MKYKKGQIVEYDFPTIEGNKNVLTGNHMAVVLHARTTPYKTILVAPITSAKGLQSIGSIPENYVILKHEKYLGVLDHDSYVNLDMIFPVDEQGVNELEKYNKKIFKELDDEDKAELDFRIALTYELERFLKDQVNEEVENIIEYIDTDIKRSIMKALEVVKDEEVMKAIMYIIDNNLINELKQEYK